MTLDDIARIPKEYLTAAQVAQIRDVVLSKSSVTAQNITVVEVK